MMKKTIEAGKGSGPRRFTRPEREAQILEKAIEHFSENGFAGTTRELARKLGVTQPLLYQYYPSKAALIDRVYVAVYQWDSAWEGLAIDRAVPLRQRMHTLYKAYAKVILKREWIRTFVFSGLSHAGLNAKYVDLLRERLMDPLMHEIRESYAIPVPTQQSDIDADMTLLWGLHAAIFYLGVRRWVYNLPIPDDIDAHVERQVDAFLLGAPATLRKNASEVGTNTPPELMAPLSKPK